MKKMVLLLLLLTWSGALFGCAHEVTFGEYVEDRMDDLIDVAYLELNTESWGALINVGPGVLGYNKIGKDDHFISEMAAGKPPPEKVWRLQMGLGGFRKMNGPYSAYGLLFHNVYWKFDEQYGYRRYGPKLGSLSIYGGVYLGMGLSVDPIDFFDFFAGLFFFDPCQDDQKAYDRMYKKTAIDPVRPEDWPLDARPSANRD